MYKKRSLESSETPVLIYRTHGTLKVNEQRKCIRKSRWEKFYRTRLTGRVDGELKGIFLRCALVWAVFGLRVLLPRSEK